MTVLAHWLAFEADSLAACHYIDEAEEAANMTRLGYRVEGPFVPEQQLRGAVEALRRIESGYDFDHRLTGDDCRRIARDALKAGGQS